MFNVHGLNSSQGLSGTTNWKENSMEFDSGNQTEVLIHRLFGGYGGGVGTAWYDDVYLYEIDSGDIAASIGAVAGHFSASADPAARKALAAALAPHTNAFAKDLIVALGAAPVEVKALVRKYAPDPAVHERGLAVYNRTCIACHGPEGKGVPGAFPPLDGSSWVTGDPTIPARIILSGLQGPIEVSGQKFENIMPPHADLKDGEIADVITYIRQSWSNDATSVSKETVTQTRAASAARGKPWTASELK